MPIVINKTRSRALKYLLLWLVNLEFFLSVTFRKKWIGRAMGNEKFDWDGLRAVNVISKIKILNIMPESSN